MIPKGGHRFPAFAKPASAGEARLEKIALQLEILELEPIRLNWIEI
jgi:hypothetical protein